MTCGTHIQIRDVRIPVLSRVYCELSTIGHVVGIGDSKECTAASAAAPHGTMIPLASIGLAQHGG